jgi:hypothetical protein
MRSRRTRRNMSDLFSPSSLQKAVHDSLEQATAAIPPGKNGAILVDATTERVQVLLAERVGESWTFSVGVAYDGNHVSGKVAVAGSW